MISSTTSTSSSSSTTPTSASLSPSSSSSNSSAANYKPVHATTLSQAFDTATQSVNIKLNQMSKENATNSSLPMQMTNSLNAPKSDQSSLIMNNANSCDFNILIDKENYLLEQGLANMELIKQWYLNQLRENKLKQANIQKLKHQNLFGIDKMITDLKQLNDLNEVFNTFLSQNSTNNG